jgi:hypothetical protein
MRTTGSNALVQAREFHKAIGLSPGVILTKLDGSGKGGIAVAIQHELGIPTRFIGTGKKETDFAPYDREKFVDALLLDPEPRRADRKAKHPEGRLSQAAREARGKAGANGFRAIAAREPVLERKLKKIPGGRKRAPRLPWVGGKSRHPGRQVG